MTVAPTHLPRTAAGRVGSFPPESARAGGDLSPAGKALVREYDCPPRKCSLSQDLLARSPEDRGVSIGRGPVGVCNLAAMMEQVPYMVEGFALAP